MEALSWRKSALCLLFSFSFLAQSQSVPHRDRETLRSTSRCPIYHFELTPFYSHRANASHSITAPPPPPNKNERRLWHSVLDFKIIHFLLEFVPQIYSGATEVVLFAQHTLWCTGCLTQQERECGGRGGSGFSSGVLFVKLDVSFPVFECKYWNLLPTFFLSSLERISPWTWRLLARSLAPKLTQVCCLMRQNLHCPQTGYIMWWIKKFNQHFYIKMLYFAF